MNEEGYSIFVYYIVIKGESLAIKVGGRSESRVVEDYVLSFKYKSSLLNRYFNDFLRYVMVISIVMMGKIRRRNYSGFFSFNEFEEELVFLLLLEIEGIFVYRIGKFMFCFNYGDLCKVDKKF